MSNAENEIIATNEVETNNAELKANVANEAEINAEATTANQTNEQIPEEVIITAPGAVENSQSSEAGAPADDDEAKKAAELKQQKFNEAFEKIKAAKDNNSTLTVEIKDRIRGGLRVMFDEIPIFLPASHFSLKRNPSEEELQAAIGSTIEVKVHELSEDSANRKTVLVSRRQLLEDDFWTKVKVGDIVEGPVSSIASFGIFIDLGGIEGLIHISRLSQVHVADTKSFAKKGQIIKALVVEVDRDKNRIALSRKDLEESPWSNISEKYPIGSRHKGIVRRITDFGAYIEMERGVDGLLRTGEISWTKRIKSPDEVIKINDEVEVEIISVSEEKKTMSLSLKRTIDNPWIALAEKFPLNSEHMGTVSQVMTQGVIITLEGDIDGFMPRSKMKNVLRGKKIPYNVGEQIECIISDITPEQESLILAPKASEQAAPQREDRREPRRPQETKKSADSNASAFTFGDLLSESAKKILDSATK